MDWALVMGVKARATKNGPYIKHPSSTANLTVMTMKSLHEDLKWIKTLCTEAVSYFSLKSGRR